MRAQTEASPLQPGEVGKRLVNVPYNQLSLWGDYSFGDFGLPQLKVGLGARYIGRTRGMAHSVPVSVPAFTVFDAMVSYTTGPWRLALNLTNLTDKTYVSGCTYGCFLRRAAQGDRHGHLSLVSGHGPWATAGAIRPWPFLCRGTEGAVQSACNCTPPPACGRTLSGRMDGSTASRPAESLARKRPVRRSAATRASAASMGWVR